MIKRPLWRIQSIFFKVGFDVVNLSQMISMMFFGRGLNFVNRFVNAVGSTRFFNYGWFFMVLRLNVDFFWMGVIFWINWNQKLRNIIILLGNRVFSKFQFWHILRLFIWNHRQRIIQKYTLWKFCFKPVFVLFASESFRF